MADKTKRFLKQFAPKRTALGKMGGHPLELPNFSRGKAPESDRDLANKKYVDDNAAGSHTESSTDSLTNKTIDDFSNHVEADEIHEKLRNESGDSMTRGDAVYISGFSVGQVLALVSLADSTDSSAMPMIAILEDSTLANNATGHFIEQGTLEDVDTNSWNVGDELYISETGTTTNTLTSTKPTGTALIQKVAVVLRKHASNGVLEIFGAGRQNDLPNIANTKVWIGDTNGVPQEFAISGDATMTAGGDLTVTELAAISGVTVTNTSHVADSSDPHGVTLTQTGLVSSGAISGVKLAMTADHTTSGVALCVGIITAINDTPPTASDYAQGTIYVQYTA